MQGVGLETELYTRRVTEWSLGEDSYLLTAHTECARLFPSCCVRSKSAEWAHLAVLLQRQASRRCRRRPPGWLLASECRQQRRHFVEWEELPSLSVFCL